MNESLQALWQWAEAKREGDAAAFSKASRAMLLHLLEQRRRMAKAPLASWAKARSPEITRPSAPEITRDRPRSPLASRTKAAALGAGEDPSVAPCLQHCNRWMVEARWIDMAKSAEWLIDNARLTDAQRGEITRDHPR